MSDVHVVTGDDVVILNYLVKEEQAVNIPLAATITCKIVSLDQGTDYCSEVSQVNTESEADWPAGLVACRFPSATTQEIRDNTNIDWKKGSIPAKLLTRINDVDGISTFLEVITISRG
jgi:hypothetical protein